MNLTLLCFHESYIIKIGVSHFGMYAIGEEVNINCVDTSKTADQVEWLNSTGTVLIFSLSSTVTLNIDMITDEHHGLFYTCRIRSSAIVHSINYNIIVLGENCGTLAILYNQVQLFNYFCVQCPQLQFSFKSIPQDMDH